MDAGFGGPVWHASIAAHDRNGRPEKVGDSADHMLRAARALSNVGDGRLGEWQETGNVAFHLRRRVSADEWAGRPWVMDLRHTDEGRRRLMAVDPKGVARRAGVFAEEW